MFILELLQPGVFLKHGDDELSFKVMSLLKHMENAFFEAHLALHNFNYHHSSLGDLIEERTKQRVSDKKRRTEIETSIRRELAGQPELDYRTFSFEVDVRLKREKWDSGMLPDEFKQSFSHMYAKSFVSALDTVEKILKRINSIPNPPEIIGELLETFKNDIQDLRGVRDSTQHIDARLLGLGRSKGKGKAEEPLEPKPIKSKHINSEVGVIALGVLSGTAYGMTKADGEYGEIDISQETLKKVQKIVQAALDSFEWFGPKIHLPT